MASLDVLFLMFYCLFITGNSPVLGATLRPTDTHIIPIFKFFVKRQL